MRFAYGARVRGGLWRGVLLLCVLLLLDAERCWSERHGTLSSFAIHAFQAYSISNDASYKWLAGDVDHKNATVWSLRGGKECFVQLCFIQIYIYIYVDIMQPVARAFTTQQT